MDLKDLEKIKVSMGFGLKQSKYRISFLNKKNQVAEQIDNNFVLTKITIFSILHFNVCLLWLTLTTSCDIL